MIKKTIFTLSSILLMSLFIYWMDKPPDNKYILTEGQVIILSNAVGASRQILSNSQAPAIQVTQINNSFDSVMTVLIKQYQNFHPDTLTKKK